MIDDVVVHVGLAADDEFCEGWYAIVLTAKYSHVLGHARGHTPLDAIDRALQQAHDATGWRLAPKITKRFYLAA